MENKRPLTILKAEHNKSIYFMNLANFWYLIQLQFSHFTHSFLTQVILPVLIVNIYRNIVSKV